MTDKPRPTPKVKLEMGKRKSGLDVPKEAVDICRHGEVMAGIQPRLDQFVCGGCDEKVLMVILQFSLMTPEIFEEFKTRQAEAMQAAQRKQQTGLVTPDDVRREQQEKKG